ncbi:MAG: ABC transporter ATP-binding protein, partial [Tannerellaceae bacterium]|nr:ABC transporter ATP-binding protein [Tannerellaceae bacterium]
MERQQIAIQATNLSIGYVLKGGNRKVVNRGLDLELYSGEVTCLLGLNGAGKSTLLRTLCGFQPPLEGTIMLMGKPLTDYSQSLFSLTVGVVLTEKTNAGGITVYELVSLGRYPYTGFFGRLSKKDKQIINDSLEEAGIAHKAFNYVSELSDGERQKAMIAKALAQECPVILLDEPTAFLDVTSRIETMSLLRKLAVEQGKAILLSTHDLDLAIQLGDRLWVQEKRQQLVCGTPEDLILNG